MDNKWLSSEARPNRGMGISNNPIPEIHALDHSISAFAAS